LTLPLLANEGHGVMMSEHVFDLRVAIYVYPADRSVLKCVIQRLSFVLVFVLLLLIAYICWDIRDNTQSINSDQEPLYKREKIEPIFPRLEGPFF